MSSINGMTEYWFFTDTNDDGGWWCVSHLTSQHTVDMINMGNYGGVLSRLSPLRWFRTSSYKAFPNAPCMEHDLPIYIYHKLKPNVVEYSSSMAHSWIKKQKTAWPDCREKHPTPAVRLSSKITKLVTCGWSSRLEIFDFSIPFCFFFQTLRISDGTLQKRGVWICMTQGAFWISSPHQALEIPRLLGNVLFFSCSTMGFSSLFGSTRVLIQPTMAHTRTHRNVGSCSHVTISSLRLA